MEYSAKTDLFFKNIRIHNILTNTTEFILLKFKLVYLNRSFNLYINKHFTVRIYITLNCYPFPSENLENINLSR